MNERDLFFKRVQEDLSPFRDPGTVLEVEQKGAQLRVSWLQRRKQMSAVFTYEIGHQDVEFEEAKYSYRSFFAGDQMADIAGIAQSSLGLHSIPEYVATTAAVALSTGEVEEDGDAIEVIARVSQGSDLSRASTGFVMVTAGAGAGKTRTLRELVARQAKQYLSGASSYVYLYVDAQGRALAKFHEALSTELNDLRVSLPYHAVAVLVRMGLVVPVIDGFDELIGVGGYDDAFSSIASFVDDLEGMGCIVASARSTYYEQEFLSRSSRRSENSSQSWELATVEVKGWGDVQRENYLHALIPVDADRRSRIRSSVVKAFAGVNAQLADKPLFYVSVAKLFAEDESIVLGGTSLLQSLVEVFLIRECREKLLDRNSNNILDVKQLSSLVSDLAEEMWSQSTRELEKQTVKELAELSVMGPDVAEASAAIVVERMPSMAFLKRGESAGSVAFEHELFFDYFLSDRLVLRLKDVGPHSVVALGRSAMPQSLAEQVASKQLAEGGDVPALVQSLVKIVASPSMRRLQVAENAGKLIGELVVRKGSISGAKLVDVIFPGSSLAGVSFDGVAFSGCIFRRVGLAATKFGDCAFSATQFEAPLVSAETRFSNCVGLDESNFFSGLRSSDSDGKVRTVARPDDVRTLLSHMGVLTETNVLQLRDVSTEAVALVERMLRICARCNPVAFEDEQFRTIGQSSLWPQVRRIAMDSGVFKVESGVQTRGPGKEFLRRTVSVEDLWAGLVSSEVDVPDASKIFWTRLEEEFPANSGSN